MSRPYSEVTCVARPVFIVVLCPVLLAHSRPEIKLFHIFRFVDTHWSFTANELAHLC